MSYDQNVEENGNVKTAAVFCC